MNYYAIRIDRNSINVIYYTLAVYVLMSVSEIVVRSHDGLTTSLAPYLPILLGTVWAAPCLAREIESETLAWAWTKGVKRRAWLLHRVASIFIGAFLSGIILSILIMVTQIYWWPAMTIDRITPALLSGSLPVLVAYCLFAVSVGVFFAVVTKKVITSIGLTFLTVAAISYALPALAVHWAPTKQTSVPLQTGHIIKQQLTNGITTTTYVSNSSFWPLSCSVALVVLLFGAVLMFETLRRVRRISL